MNCRHCHNKLTHRFVDLGTQPASNNYLSEAQIKEKIEVPQYPLVTYVCQHCWLVQTQDFAAPSTFFSADYAYFSSTSKGWLAHAKAFSEKIIEQLELDSRSFVVEVAANDGYLLKNFVQENIPCLGIEPTLSTAEAAKKLTIPVVTDFFGLSLAKRLVKEHSQADLIVCNNVLAHVPDINDFTAGLSSLLAPKGTITIEFPHLLNLIKFNQFDTIYHEHFSYFSLYSAIQVLKASGLKVYDVQELNTHGGSLRLLACHDYTEFDISNRVKALLKQEQQFGLQELAVYSQFQQRIESTKLELVQFLVEQKQLGKKVVAYGAAAKGNTLLNFSGVSTELLPCVYDAAPSKQGKYMPGSKIPILPPEQMDFSDIDFVLILPWNIKEEVIKQLEGQATLSTNFVVCIPEFQIVNRSHD